MTDQKCMKQRSQSVRDDLSSLELLEPQYESLDESLEGPPICCSKMRRVGYPENVSKLVEDCIQGGLSLSRGWDDLAVSFGNWVDDAKQSFDAKTLRAMRKLEDLREDNNDDISPKHKTPSPHSRIGPRCAWRFPSSSLVILPLFSSMSEEGRAKAPVVVDASDLIFDSRILGCLTPFCLNDVHSALAAEGRPVLFVMPQVFMALLTHPEIAGSLQAAQQAAANLDDLAARGVLFCLPRRHIYKCSCKKWKKHSMKHFHSNRISPSFYPTEAPGYKTVEDVRIMMYLTAANGAMLLTNDTLQFRSLLLHPIYQREAKALYESGCLIPYMIDRTNKDEFRCVMLAQH